MSTLHAILAVVGVQRVAELALARRNTRGLRARGAVEIDARTYPLFVMLHAAWLCSMALLVPAATVPSWPLLGFFALLQLARVWVIASLGRRWTTRIIILPGTPLVRTGPYRYFRHPNYMIVAGEVALLPLAFSAPVIAAVFSAANAMLLARRVRCENRALAGQAPEAV